MIIILFYGADRITKTLINKAKNSDYLKDKVLLGFYWELKDENEVYFDEKKQETTSTTYMPFAEQWKHNDSVQSWTKCMRQTLVFISNSAVQENFNFSFSAVFC